VEINPNRLDRTFFFDGAAVELGAIPIETPVAGSVNVSISQTLPKIAQAFSVHVDMGAVSNARQGMLTGMG